MAYVLDLLYSLSPIIPVTNLVTMTLMLVLQEKHYLYIRCLMSLKKIYFYLCPICFVSLKHPNTNILYLFTID